MRSTFSVLLLFTSSILCAQTAAEYFVTAQNDFQGENYRRALKSYTKAIDLDKKNADYFFARGKCFFQWGVFDNSKEDLDQAIYLDSLHADALHYRAQYYFIIEHYKGCVNDNSLALSNTENKELITACLLNRGEAKLMLKDAQGAYEDLKIGMGNNKSDLAAVRVMASVLHELKMHEEALEYLDILIENEPRNIGARINKGFELDALGRYAEAVSAYDSARIIDKDEPLVYSNRAHALYGLGQYESALKDVNKSIANQPLNAFAYHTRAQIRIAQNNESKACKDLNTAKKMGYSIEVNDLYDKHCR